MLLFSVLVIFLTLVADILPTNITKPSPKIVGGILATKAQFPYQTSIQRASSKNSHFCGGSIIGRKHVLTAAHCVQGKKAADLMIWVGGIEIGVGGSYHKVNNIFVHEAYEGETQINDIAVLRIKDELEISSYVNLIDLNTEQPKSNILYTVSGWGTTRYGDETQSRHLLFVKVPMVDLYTCQQKYGILYDDVICAGSAGHDSCQGDSGGPLVYNGSVYGIVSFGFECGTPGYPGVYTKVSSYIEWIKKQKARSFASYININHIHIIAMIIAGMLYPVFFK